ncbi:MAG TPA: alpha/beta hydrolase [Leeuwenhoekiella sp.]|nr:alpha/beta hydrolase [Leeuwenhoekiella sp.]
MTQLKIKPILKKTIFLSILLFGIIYPVQSQREIISLWKSDIPGGKSDATYKEEQQMEGGKLVGVNRVTQPEMTVFKPEEPNGTAVVICPGGGYGHLAIDKEGFKIAEWFNERGITAFVLKYRLPSDLIMDDKTIGPLQDAQQAIRLVRKNAKQYSIDTTKIGIMGFSAGGHLASTLSTHYNDNVYKATNALSAKPDFAILLYPVISMMAGITHQGSRENLLGTNPSAATIERFSNEKQVTGKTPVTFLVHAADDGAVPVANSIEYFMALNKNKVPAEMHVYENGGHGFGLGTQATNNSWPDALELWLTTRKLIDAE